jgi:EAL domain-containing protein (putative c-di-GMP-specific phosphodiesterase class I)
MLASHGDITEALERGEIEPFFQPHMDMTTGGWIGFEALARWRNPQSGMVQPSQFLPLAERTGLIRHIDLAIADRSMAICQAIPGERRPYLNLNFSAWHFRDENLVQRIAQLLEKHGFAPERLRVELTETLMLDEPDRALRIMTALAELGIKLALDDFGTGFSSLSVLHLMPIDILKIDQSLTLGVLREGRPRTVLKHVIALARDLGMETIVEGVETQAMAEALIELGCHVGQGYHLARPLPAEEATAGWLAESRKTSPVA